MVDNSARGGEKQADAAGELSELSQLASERTPETIERALAAAKEELGMDVASSLSAPTVDLYSVNSLVMLSRSGGERARIYRWMTPTVGY